MHKKKTLKKCGKKEFSRFVRGQCSGRKAMTASGRERRVGVSWRGLLAPPRTWHREKHGQIEIRKTKIPRFFFEKPFHFFWRRKIDRTFFSKAFFRGDSMWRFFYIWTVWTSVDCAGKGPVNLSIDWLIGWIEWLIDRLFDWLID